jgi:hypothetical protein
LSNKHTPRSRQTFCKSNGTYFSDVAIVFLDILAEIVVHFFHQNIAACKHNKKSQIATFESYIPSESANSYLEHGISLLLKYF